MTLAVLETVLAGMNVERGLRDAIAGDLLEERALQAANTGERCADRWLRRQVIRSIPCLVIDKVRNGGWQLLLSIVGAAAAAMLAVSLVVGIAATLSTWLIPLEWMRRFAIAVLLADLGFGAAGGYLAARLGRSAPLGAAFAFGLFSLVITAWATHEGSSWYGLALQSLLLPATFSGGWLRARGLTRSAR